MPSERPNMLNEMIAEGRYFMLEDIRKRNARGYYNADSENDIQELLSLIDKYREEMNIMTFKYNGAFQRCEEALQMLFTMDEENKKYKEENGVLRKAIEDLENVVNRVDEEMKPSE